MKKIVALFAFLLSFVSNTGNAQETAIEKPALTDNFNEKLDKKPEFPGGPDYFNHYVFSNLNTSEVSESVDLKIMTSFIVESDGSVSNARVENKLGYGLEEEVVRVLQNCPKWKPGEIEGKPERSLIKYPISVSIKVQPSLQKKYMAKRFVPPPPYPNVEIQPEYPGGIKELHAFVRGKFKMPEEAYDLNLNVFISFFIEEDGSMTEFKVLNDPGYGIAEEIIRVFKKCHEKWKPAMDKGVVVRCNYNIPLRIKVK